MLASNDYAHALQFVFLMNKNGAILSCDESGKHFLANIDMGIFHAQIHSIKINAAVTNTTIIIGTTSYNLRLVPVEISEELFPKNLYSSNELVDFCEYIIVVQNQASFSEIYQKLNQLSLAQVLTNVTNNLPSKSNVYDILEKQNCGIFITNSSGSVVFVNKIYEDTTGILRENIVGKNLTTLKNEGILNPLITPTILRTGEVYTTIQKLGTGKVAIISGTPIYDYSGTPILIITAVNTIDNIHLDNYQEEFYEPSKIISHMNRRINTHSIDIIAESTVMKTIVQEALKVAQHDVSVLILGESGVGKEVISTIIHTTSRRGSGNFVKLNCSAISPSLLESELFGYEPGAFTGALNKGKIGLFEAAENGTILLDEIGDMPLALQAKMLRVLQDKEIYRVGGVTPIKINARVLASTNKDLRILLSEGNFREDLFYRLNVVSIEMSPLRNRKEDIRPLLLHFCYIYNKKYHTNKTLSDELLNVLEEYKWPGNIRELQNVVERLIVLCLDNELKADHFYHRYRFQNYELNSKNGVHIESIIPLREAISQTEKLLVEKALENSNSTREAAKLLEVSQSTIMRKIKEHEIKFK